MENCKVKYAEGQTISKDGAQNILPKRAKYGYGRRIGRQKYEMPVIPLWLRAFIV